MNESPKLERYILDHTTSEDQLLQALDRETHLKVVQPRMISGHLQGELLKMMVRMIRPRRILEVGTFTGYSAICMAMGLEVGGELHTYEVDDELEALAARYFEAIAPRLEGRIVQHVGSFLELSAQISEPFDLVFLDGDKREYPAYYERLFEESLVRSGSYILADNILWYGKVTEPAPANDLFTQGIQRFNRMVVEDARVENTILPIRDGLNLIRVL